MLFIKPQAFVTNNRTIQAFPARNCVYLENPYDLRPAADAIMDILHTKMQRVAPEKPIVLLMGENHAAPAHILLQKLILSRLLDEEYENPTQTFAYGLELPNEVNQNTLKNIYGLTLAESRKLLGSEEGLGVQCAFLHTKYSAETTATRDDVKLFLYYNKIACGFHDLDSRDIQIKDGDQAYVSVVLNNSNARSSRYINELYAKHGRSQINSIDNIGLHIRNRAIVDDVLETLEKNKKKLYVLSCGALHVFGSSNQFSYRFSLSALFAKAGIETVSVIPAKYVAWHEALPKQAARHAQDSVLIAGIDTPPSGCAYKKGVERGLMHRIDQESGGEIGIWSDPHKHTLLLSKNLQEKAAAVISARYKHMP
ncbi:MAG: hypothetical protein DI551_01350 [Micavibrio aeruginosavorus]|uniref:Haem-binding uptake Tiki superfamily ChaN domain-containing protein n=1 Tax=Micavibrio aeruginosavorus TaxID=349221 RepID=A0A2W5N5A1_9BACT|nr:MAG: hypothetical protein DI551_01350 [Micavibrio aeruginosavorus]